MGGLREREGGREGGRGGEGRGGEGEGEGEGRGGEGRGGEGRGGGEGAQTTLHPMKICFSTTLTNIKSPKKESSSNKRFCKRLLSVDLQECIDVLPEGEERLFINQGLTHILGAITGSWQAQSSSGLQSQKKSSPFGTLTDKLTQEAQLQESRSLAR